MITRLPKLRLGKQSLELQLAQTLFAQPEQLDPQLVETIVRSLKTPAPALNQIAALGQITPTQLGQVLAPVLLVWGLADQLIPVTWADEFSQYLPQSHTVLMPNCGHLPQLECATLFQAQLSSFLRSIAEISTGRHHSTKQ
jgi:pimeloyl-ACP methyl ester carboxylesterase